MKMHRSVARCHTFLNDYAILGRIFVLVLNFKENTVKSIHFLMKVVQIVHKYLLLLPVEDMICNFKGILVVKSKQKCPNNKIHAFMTLNVPWQYPSPYIDTASAFKTAFIRIPIFLASLCYGKVLSISRSMSLIETLRFLISSKLPFDCLIIAGHTLLLRGSEMPALTALIRRLSP